MLPTIILKDRLWLRLAILLLCIGWSLPVVALALSAEDREVSASVFAIVWTGVIACLGLWLYRIALKSSSIFSLTIVLAIATVSLLYRVPLSFIRPELIAEDACVFFEQQRDAGWGAFLMTDAGYYHTWIRIYSAVFACVPTLFVPAFYNLAWLGTYCLVAAYILFQYPDRKLAPYIVLVTAFISHSCETYMTITNSIWIMGLGMTAFALFPVPDVRKWAQYVIAAILLIFSLSGPFGVILSPFYCLRWVANRKSFSLLYVAAIVLGALVQLWAIHNFYARGNAGVPLTAATFWLCLEIVVLRVPWSLMVGYQPIESYWLLGLIPMAALLGFTALEVKNDYKKQLFPVGCIILCAIYVLLNLVRVAPLEALAVIGDGDRYFYIPKVLFVWALIHLAVNARYPKPFQVVLIFCVFGAMVNYTSKQTIADNQWPHYAALIDQGQTVKVPINPYGWSALIKGIAVPVQE